MKKTTILFAITGVVLIVGTACNKEASYPDPDADCWVFVSTIPGKETILLAKSGLSENEANVVWDGFTVEYGENNVRRSVGFPGGINNFEIDEFEIGPDFVTNCYEQTFVIDFSESAAPSIEKLLNHRFRGVRINDNVAICKEYFWAYTEEGAAMCEEINVNSYNSLSAPWIGGKIVNSSYEKLGPDVHNRKITF